MELEKLVRCPNCNGAGILDNGESCPVCWLGGCITWEKYERLKEVGEKNGN